MADTPATPAKPQAPLVNPAGTIEQRIALAKSKTGAAPAAEPAPVTAEAGEGADTETVTEEGSAPAETEAEGETTEETEGEAVEAPAGTPEERLAAIDAAFESGDFDAVCKAAGKDPAKVNLPTKKRFRALARELVKVQTATRKFTAAKATGTAELAAESNRISQLQRGLAQKYQHDAAMAKAWEDEDFLAFGKALEKKCGSDLATITQKLASGKTGKTPEEKALADQKADLARQQAKLEEDKRKGEADKSNAQKRDAAIARTAEQLKGHPYLADKDGQPDPEALSEVFEAYEKTWDPKARRFTKTAKQVADELQAALKAKAAKRGIVAFVAPNKGTQTTPAARPKPKPPAGTRLPEPPRTTPRKDLGTKEHLDSTREMRIAQAKKIAEQQSRGLRG